MKRLLSVVALAFTAILALAGCANMNLEVHVSGPDKASGAVEVTASQAALQGMSLDDLIAQQGGSDALNKALAGQWTYSKIEDGQSVGVRFETAETMTYQELEDAFALFGISFDLNDDGQVVNYSMDSIAGQLDASYEEATMSVTFPSTITAHSAGTVEHHTVDFDLKQIQEPMSASGKFDSSMFYSIIFGGALLVLTLVFVGAFAPKAKKESH